MQENSRDSQKDLRGKILRSVKLNKKAYHIRNNFAHTECEQSIDMELSNNKISKQRKCHIVLIAVWLMVFALFAVVAFCVAPKSQNELKLVSAWSGSGTQSSPYEITTYNDLTTLATNVNAGTTYAGKYFALMNDITTSATTWTPIGTSTNQFAGTFDGKGNKIIFSAETVSFSSYGGIFGYINGTSKITSLIINTNEFLGGNDDICGIVGANNGGEITKCGVVGKIRGVHHGPDSAYEVGGICITNQGTILNCYYSGDLYSGIFMDGPAMGESTGYYVAGISANNRGEVENCWVYGSIDVNGSSYGGASIYSYPIVGGNGGIVNNCVYLMSLPTGGTGSISATEAQMKLASTYKNLGWSEGDWILVDGELPQLLFTTYITLNINVTLDSNIDLIIINIMQNETIVGQYALEGTQALSIELLTKTTYQIVVSKPYLSTLNINNQPCNTIYSITTQASAIDLNLVVSGNGNWNNAIVV